MVPLTDTTITLQFSAHLGEDHPSCLSILSVNLSHINLLILDFGVTSHNVIDQSMIINFEMNKIFGGEAKQNPQDSTWTPMYINLFAIFQQKLNILIKITSGPYRH